MTFEVTFFGWGAGLVIAGWICGLIINAILRGVTKIGGGHF